MKHRHRGARRRLHMRLSQLIWQWRDRAYLYSATSLALLTLVFIFSGGVRAL